MEGCERDVTLIGRKQMRKYLLSFASVGVLAIASASPSYALIIDQFNGTQSVTANSTTPSSSSSDGTAIILGGERDVTVNWISGGLGATVNVVGGHIAYSADAGVIGSMSVSWDGIDGSPAVNAAGFAATDLTEGGVNTAFGIDVISADLGGGTLTITACATIASCFSVATPLPAGLGFGFDVDFAAFVGAPAGFFTAITHIQLDLTHAVAAYDAEFDLFLTRGEVPEPATLALFGLGLAGLGLARRRKA